MNIFRCHYRPYARAFSRRTSQQPCDAAAEIMRWPLVVAGLGFDRGFGFIYIMRQVVSLRNNWVNYRKIMDKYSIMDQPHVQHIRARVCVSVMGRNGLAAMPNENAVSECVRACVVGLWS